VSPLLDLLTAGAVASLPRACTQWGAAALVLALAAWLQIGDFAPEGDAALRP